MGKKLYVGNLTYGVTDSDLQQMFEAARHRAVGAGHHGPRHRPLQGVRLRGDGQRRGGPGGHRGPQRQGSRRPRPDRQRGPAQDRGRRRAAAAVAAAAAAAAAVAAAAVAAAAAAAVATKS